MGSVDCEFLVNRWLVFILVRPINQGRQNKVALSSKKKRKHLFCLIE